MSTSRSRFAFAALLAVAMAPVGLSGCAACSRADDLSSPVAFDGSVGEGYSRRVTGGSEKSSSGASSGQSQEGFDPFDVEPAGDAERATGAFRTGLVGGSWSCERTGDGLHVTIRASCANESISDANAKVSFSVMADGKEIGSASGEMGTGGPGSYTSFSVDIEGAEGVDANKVSVVASGPATEGVDVLVNANPE